MKTTGIILIVLSFFCFVGCINSGSGLFGPSLLLASGIFCLYRANKKENEPKQESDAKDNTTENN